MLQDLRALPQHLRALGQPGESGAAVREVLPVEAGGTEEGGKDSLINW